jgi:hypothetical protein
MKHTSVSEKGILVVEDKKNLGAATNSVLIKER